MWSMFVDGLSGLLTQLAQWLDGSYGLAVLVMAISVRLLLLPLTLHAAEQASAMQDLYRRHGITGGLGSGMLTAIVQAPLGAGLYAAIRQGVTGAGAFLWIGKLARPDIWLAVLAALLSCAAILLQPAMSEQVRTLLHWLPVVVVFLVTWHLSAGLGLYWAGAGSVGVLQSVLLRRRIARAGRRPAPSRR